MVRSLDRNTGKTLVNRLRRLLPALWVMGLILVPVMLHHGWKDVLLSPLLLRLYRRASVPTVLPPQAGLLALTMYPDTFGQTAGWVLQNVSVALAARRKPRISPFVRRPPLEPARGVATVPTATY
jgi:hypothetical protein